MRERPDAKQVVTLKVQWTGWGLRLAPDPRQVKDTVEDVELALAKLADTPMPVSQPSRAGCNSPDLRARGATLYRRLVAKVNFVAMDRSDIRDAASILGSRVPCPQEADMVKLKLVGRFLLGKPTTWTHHLWDVQSDHIMAFTDSDWAADREDRSIGGMLVHH